MIVYLDGEYIPRERACVSVDDRGFLFGDGVYEVIRACNGALFTAEEHLGRLQEGLDALQIDLSSVADRSSLLRICHTLLERNRQTEGNATVYLQVTRGAAPRTHCYPPAGCRPTVYLSTAPLNTAPHLHESGAAAITFPDLRWTRCNLKTVNLLPNVIAKQRAVEAGASEAILIRDGVLTEGASTNVFAVADGRIRTYPASHYILGGITRRIVIELAAEFGVPVIENPVRVEDLDSIDELFLTGTTTDVMPVICMNDRPVGNGAPGPVTRKLQQALAQRMDAACARTH